MDWMIGCLEGVGVDAGCESGPDLDVGRPDEDGMLGCGEVNWNGLVWGRCWDALGNSGVDALSFEATLGFAIVWRIVS